MIETEALSISAIEVLNQLFTCGPTCDGNIVCKPGRGELYKLGLVDRLNGFVFLTVDGVRLASEWDYSELCRRGYKNWADKVAYR